MKANRFNFRVWDRKNKIFIHDFHLLSEAEDGFVFFDKEYTVEHNDNNNYILMQSTGLVDKNGKEIFEGDIIKITKEFEDLIDEVFYDKELCSIRLKGYSNDYCDFADWIREGFEFKVIGNIYENKKLLKKIKD